MKPNFLNTGAQYWLANVLDDQRSSGTELRLRPLVRPTGTVKDPVQCSVAPWASNAPRLQKLAQIVADDRSRFLKALDEAVVSAQRK